MLDTSEGFRQSLQSALNQLRSDRLTVRVRHVEAVMGTAFTIDGVFTDLDHSDALAVVADASASLHKVDAMFSTWNECSPLSRFRRGELAAEELPQEVVDVLDACRQPGP